MHGLYAIYRKEMGHYFVSPIAYIFIGLFLILTAFFFNAILTASNQTIFSDGNAKHAVRAALEFRRSRQRCYAVFSACFPL